jgi:hypothetical protein
MGLTRREATGMKFYATVCLPVLDRDDVLPALRAALAPYDNAGVDAMRNGKWDWWHLYSPAGAEFVVRPECDDDPRLVHNDAYVDGRPRARTPLRCDGGPKRLLDLEAIRGRARAAAQSRWNAFAALTVLHPPAESLSQLIARHRDDPDPVTAAKVDHLAQPLMQDIAQRALSQTDPHFGMAFLTHDPIEHFGQDRDAYIRREEAEALLTHALITTDGRWIDEDDDDTTEPFAILMDNHIMTIDGDAYILRVLCHY